MKKIIVICLSLLFLSSPLIASTIPQYPLSSVDNTTITFVNQTVFEALGFFSHISQSWMSGDQVLLCKDDATFPAIFTHKNNLPFIPPLIIIKNVTRGTKLIAWHVVPPTAGSTSVVSADPATGQIALSDSSVWTVPESDRTHLEIWSPGDLVLIGGNTGINNAIFDAFLLNADRQNTVKAVEL